MLCVRVIIVRQSSQSPPPACEFHVCPLRRRSRWWRCCVVLAGCSLFHRGKKGDPTATRCRSSSSTSTASKRCEAATTISPTRSYERLIARFPFGPYTEQAQIELAYAQYKDDKPDDAYSTINRFIKTYPTQKHIDYAYYLRGLINFDRTGRHASSATSART